MTDLMIPEGTEPVNLDMYAALVKQEEYIRELIGNWTTQLKDVQRQIQELMGSNEEATFAGKPAYTWRYIDGMNETAFKKDYPQLAAAYTKLVEVEKIDRDLLRAGQPDIYRKYQTRQFKRVS